MKRYIPESRYKKAKSTDGTEFVEVISRERYKGFYIETYKGKYYGGKTPEEDGPELEKISKINFAIPLGLLGLLAGFFKKKPTQSEIQNGVTKRNFIQDKNNNKIIETDPDTYEQAKEFLPNSTFAEIDWIIGGPAEDIVYGTYAYEGAASKNKKTIEELNKTIPGINTFVTDYSYLVEDTTTTTATVQNLAVSQSALAPAQTFVEQDQQTQIENFRKANFDLRK
jgi:hypothetical protein